MEVVSPSLTLVVHHTHAPGGIRFITIRHGTGVRRIAVTLANGTWGTTPVNLHVMRKTDLLGIEILVTSGNSTGHVAYSPDKDIFMILPIPPSTLAWPLTTKKSLRIPC